ncbi:alpha-hydroxy acid oxidase [Kineococcus indalonis]|uniref:alpha-hydroxy acid oxidase n=1 Tax=Kineococcus indalonis TaxID=2696566 RepID=UPI0014132E7A|nr:alpha-hydroxy acid oxidase [Kineococcus indalonis]NAZ86291.1 alpha-hydroxy-acid oxidizing enzyme [Kineococcus indalonis]
MTWVEEVHRRADEQLPDYVAAYFSTSAGYGQCQREGLQAWDALRLRPSVLRDTSAVSTATTVLGTPVAFPVLVAPMAQQVAARPQGEVLTARAAAAAGTLLGVSTNTGVAFADVAAAGAPWWYQVYVMQDRSLTQRLVERAAAAGAGALVLTVDTTALAPALPSVEPTDWPETYRKARVVNLTDAEREAAGPHAMRSAEDLTPDVIGWLRELTGLPVAVKGVLTARDARRCVDAGADAVIVSTHGGRRLGTSVTSVRALPEVVAEVGGEVEVHVDSGVREGHHVVAALAMGARAVHVGRPVMWGLAADGQAGVAAVLERLRADTVTTLRQLGVPGVAQLHPSDVARP